MQSAGVSIGSPELLRKVRANFTEKGTSLRAWCLNHGVQPSYAHRVLAGAKNGPSAQELRRSLLRASDIAA